jgi:hypothetical protein
MNICQESIRANTISVGQGKSTTPLSVKGGQSKPDTAQLKERGDPWRLNDEAQTAGPPST